MWRNVFYGDIRVTILMPAIPGHTKTNLTETESGPHGGNDVSRAGSW